MGYGIATLALSTGISIQYSNSQGWLDLQSNYNMGESDDSSKIEAQKACIANFEQLNVLEMVVDLIERLDKGTISAKELDNEAGPIRLKLSNARTSLGVLEGLDETLTERRTKIENLEEKIARQTALLEKFKGLIKESMDNSMES